MRNEKDTKQIKVLRAVDNIWKKNDDNNIGSEYL
jgi:hypothetical protein